MTRAEWLAAVTAKIATMQAALADVAGLAQNVPESAPIPAPIPTPVPTPSGKLPIYVYSPNAVSAAVMAAYNASRNDIIYGTAIPDVTKDGRWDGKTAAYTNKLASVSASAIYPITLDWENTDSSDYGCKRIQLGVGGFYGATVQKTAESEILKALNAWKSDRPNAKWGYYDIPRFSYNDLLNHYTDTYVANIQTVGHNLWAASGVISSSHYCTFKEGSADSIGSGGAGTITRATLKLLSQRRATKLLQCAENGGNNPIVMPFISRHYYNGFSSPSFYGQVVPDEWIYQHVYWFCQTQYNGRRVAAVQVWSRGADSPMTEAQLKAIYQGANGLPFDPSAARPS